jgi:AraC-like DNA-binding protein
VPEIRETLPDFLSEACHRRVRTLFRDYAITMISCFHWRNAAPWKLAWRTCPDTFFLFPMEGTVRGSLKGGSFILRPGEFLMLPEKVRHILELAKGHKRLRQFALHCHIHDRWGRSLLARFSSHVGTAPRPFLRRALGELTCLMSKDPEVGQQRGEMLVRELLLSQISRGMTLKPVPAASDPRVGVVLQAMEQEMTSSELSIEALARRVEITSVQLRKLFRRETDMGPKQFLHTLRLRKAARLLRHSKAGIKEIAASCGFATDHYFHLVFRKAFSCTPTDYRHKSSREI